MNQYVIWKRQQTAMKTQVKKKLKFYSVLQTYLKSTIESLVQWDTNDQENEEYYLGLIEQDQIISEYSSPITTEFPITPELSPRKHLLSPITRNSQTKRSVSPLIHYNLDQLSESDDHKPSSLYLPHHSKKSNRNQAIQTLQIEVAALCEEIDQLRRNNVTNYMSKWRWLWLFKSIAKHAFFNFLILMMLFIVLWRRKSPIAYAVISYAGPRLRDFMSYIFKRLMFWSVTV